MDSKCIFCYSDINTKKNFSEEHVFPESIGGTFCVYSVCIDCNSILGSEVDSELQKNHFIHRAYVKLRELNKVDEMKFRYKKNQFTTEEGIDISLTKTNIHPKVIYTPYEKGIIVDGNDKHALEELIRKRCDECNIPPFIMKEKIQKFDRWWVNKYETYTDFEIGLTLSPLIEKIITPNVTMEPKIPQRFLAKVFVEISSHFGFSDHIAEYDKLVRYSRYNEFSDELRFRYESNEMVDPEPYHTVVFFANTQRAQFSVQLFANYVIGIELTWIDTPQNFFLAFPLDKKQYHECILEGDFLISKSTIRF